MTAPVHIIGGIVISGVTGAMMDVNILENPAYLATVVIASLLPDIDHPRSPIGKLFPFISRPLGNKYGHRTITHSLICLFTLTAIVSFISNQFTEGMSYGTVFFIAYTSHLFLDMITVQGVPLFYPFWKNDCVVPGKPENRFKSGVLRTETAAFFFFIAMGVFMRPLMEQGFWTTYNRSFGTMQHLFSEFRKSDDLLEVDYLGNRGSEVIAGKGLLIHAEEEKAILVKGHEFFTLDAKDFIITEVIPTHTGRKFFYKNQTFVDIDLDSLNSLCIDNLISKIEVHGTNEFIPWTDDFQQPASNKFSGELYSNLFFQQKEKEKEELATYRHVTNPRIKLLKEKLSRLKNLQSQSEQLNAHHQQQLSKLQAAAKKETDYLKIESLLTSIKELEKRPEEKDYSTEISNTRIQISELSELDKLKRVEGNLAAAEKNKGVSDQPSRFTGFLTTLKIEE